MALSQSHETFDQIVAKLEYVSLYSCSFFSLQGMGWGSPLTDQGSNFSSKLLQELHRAMGIKFVRMSPYHLQMDRLVEWYNWTFKELLCRTIESHSMNGIIDKLTTVLETGNVTSY